MMSLTILWCPCLLLLLFIWRGAESETVTGLKGSNITLKCSLRNRENLTPILTFGSKVAFGVRQDTHFKGRVHRNGSCDLILQDLKTTDAGRYVSKVYSNNGLESTYDFFIHVKVNLTGWKHKELVLAEMPSEAESVEHITRSGQEEVWRRGTSVLTDRLTDKNGRLSIVNFTSSDEGTYRVLNSSGGILVTITVTELSTGSHDTLENTPEDETHHTERAHACVWIIMVLVLGAAFVIAVMIAVKRQDS